MRLLIVTQVVDPEHSNLGFFHEWIEEFAAKCTHVHVICLQEGVHALPPNVSVHSLGKEKGNGSRAKYVFRFFRLITRLRRDYDAVLVHMNPEYAVLGGLMWRAWGKRIALWYMHKSVSLLLRVALLLVHAAFTASAESLRIKSPKRRVVGHGISEAFFRPHVRGKGPIRILTAGRISATKRLTEMLTALDTLYSDKRDFRFTVAGAPLTEEDRRYEHLLRQEIETRPYRSSVHFLGAVRHRDLPAVLAETDVVLNFSGTGSLDKAVLEALAAGVSVITTNDAFKNAPPGALYKDSTAAAAEALRAGQADPVSGAHYVRENHSLSGLVDKILAFLA